MQLFYESDILSNNGVLNEEESRHCIKALRHNAGDTINVMDGKGHIVTGTITNDSPKSCQIRITETRFSPVPSARCTIAVAPTKNIDRIEWFLEKSTEIGVECIIPLLCSNSERKVIKPERLEKVIISAVKQSMTLWRPELMPLIEFKELIKQPFDGEKYIAYCNDDLETHLKDTYKSGNAIILIGPEGDFNDDEIKLAIKSGYKPVSLGKKRLRTETAALVACHIFRLAND